MEQDRILYTGNSTFVTSALNATRDGYDEPAVIWSGMISASVTTSQESNPLPSDNDPEKDVLYAMPAGTATITLRGILYKDFLKLMNIKYDEDNGVDFYTDEDKVKYFSFSFTEDADNRITGDKGRVRHIFYRARINNLPALTTSTISNVAPTPRDFPLDITLLPLMKPNDTTKWKFYRVQSSIENASGFNANKDTIVFPFTVTP